MIEMFSGAYGTGGRWRGRGASSSTNLQYKSPCSDYYDRLKNLLESDMWHDHVLACLDAVSTLRLSHTNRLLRTSCTSDKVWQPWVAKIDHGYYQVELAMSYALPPLGKTLKDAYMIACVHRCGLCNHWCDTIHIFSMRKICWACFSNPPAEEAFNLGIMLKNKARSVYLLGEGDIQQLTSRTVKTGKNTRASIVGRKQAKDLALSKYGDSMADLTAEKEARSAKARQRRERLIRAYQIKVEAAKLAGGPIPKAPTPSPLLNATIKEDDVGAIVQEDHVKRVALTETRFPWKLTAEDDGDGVILCKYCPEARPNVPAYQFPKYPSVLALEEHLAQEHMEEWAADCGFLATDDYDDSGDY